MSGAPLVLWLDDPAASRNPLLGGKFANLAEMTAAGFAVPHGFGVTTAAYRRFMQAAGLEAEAARVRREAPTLPLDRIRAEAATLVAGITEAPLPAEIEDAVRAGYAELGRRAGSALVPAAVRSSGESEDLAGASFAGQYDTFLWISGADAVIRNMRGCWAGMFGEAVLSYRRNGEVAIAQSDYGICVGVQQMVEARAAGVMFTLDPINGDRSKVVLEAVWGLGEGVVKGDITPSQFVIDKVTFEITGRRHATQPEEYRFDPALGAVAMAPVEEERRDCPCLEDGTVHGLARLAKHIEATRGAPQDIEWAVNQSGVVWVLQVRPETVWSRKAPSRVVAAAAPSSPVAHVLARLSGVRLTQPITGADKPS